MIRFSGQALRPRLVAVAPHDPHAKDGGGIGVPGIRRLKRDRFGRDPEPLDAELVDLRVRLIDPDCFDREDGIEEGSDRVSLVAEPCIVRRVLSGRGSIFPTPEAPHVVR